MGRRTTAQQAALPLLGNGTTAETIRAQKERFVADAREAYHVALDAYHRAQIDDASDTAAFAEVRRSAAALEAARRELFGLRKAVA